LYGRQYEVPRYTVETDIVAKKISSNRSRTPVFMDSEGTLYCIDYIPLREYSPNPQQAIENRLFCPDAPVYHNFPEPTQYKTFEEYNQRLSQWYSNTQDSVGNLLLPNVIGRRYRRPTAGLFDNLSEADKSESLSTGSLKNSSPTPSRLLEDDFDVSEMDMQSWSENVEPWESILIPAEPEPEQYSTFEAYEAAMKRWSSICSNQMKVIPPHPSQLSSLILLRTASERKNAERERAVQLRKTRPMESSGTQELNSHILPPAYTIYTHDPMENDPHRKIEIRKNSFDDDEFARVIDENEELVIKTAQKAFNGVSYDPKMITKHTGERYFLNSSRSSFLMLPSLEKALSASTEELPTVSPHFPLGYASVGLKTDHELFYRSPTLLQGNHKLLPNNQEYIRQTQRLLKALDNESRYDSFYSWHSSSELVASPVAWKLDQNNPIKALSILLLRGDALDQFHQIVSEPSKRTKQVLLDRLIPLLSPESFAELLKTFHLFESLLVRTKLAYLVGALLQRDASLLISLVKEYDVDGLFCAASLLNYFQVVPIDVFGFFPSTVPLLHQVVQSDDSVKFIEAILSNYYLSIIRSAVSQDMFADIQVQIENARTLAETDLSTMMQEQMTFMMVQLHKMLNHRSRAVTQIFVVMVSHLLEFSASSPITEILSREEIGLVDSFRQMCFSKLVHVRFGGKQLLLKLMETSHTRTLLREFYKDSPLSLVEDLFSTTGEAASFMSNFICQFATRDFETLAKKQELTAAIASQYKFLLRGGRIGSLFHDILGRIDASKNLTNPVFLNAAKLLVVLLKAYYALDIIEGYENIESLENSMSQDRSLLIVPSDVMNMFIFNERPQNDLIVFDIKKYILKGARVLSKNTRVLNAVCAEKSFLTSLVRACRDGSDYALNKESWKIFYHCFRDNRDFIQQMEEKNLVNQLLESISPGASNVVTINCLNYVCKILCLCDMEAVKVQDTGSTSRGDEDIKSIERDVKLFSATLIKHCLKVHLIYKRLEHNNISGAPFLSITNFYNIVYSNRTKTNINGSKLHRELTKNKEYKQNVAASVSMFKDESPKIVNNKPLSRSRSITSSRVSSLLRGTH